MGVFQNQKLLKNSENDSGWAFDSHLCRLFGILFGYYFWESSDTENGGFLPIFVVYWLVWARVLALVLKVFRFFESFFKLSFDSIGT
jgi:hypothetical protein